MLASFAVIPVGVGEELSRYIADLVPLIEKSGLAFRTGAMQTTVEGDPRAIISLIMKCHTRMKRKASRVLTHIAIDDRRGASRRLSGKIKDVERVLKRKVPHD